MIFTAFGKNWTFLADDFHLLTNALRQNEARTAVKISNNRFVFSILTKK